MQLDPQEGEDYIYYGVMIQELPQDQSEERIEEVGFAQEEREEELEEEEEENESN